MKSGRPCLIAALAWVKVPDVSPASIMTVAFARADIVMFRSGKNILLIFGPWCDARTTGTWLINKYRVAIVF